MSLYSGGGKRLAKSRGGKRLCAQKRRRAPRVLGLLVLCAALLTGGALCWQRMVPSGAPDSSGSDTNALPEQSPPTQEFSEDLPAEAPDDDTFLLSFAGDCTLGVEHASWGKSGTFPAVVGTDYAYPFAGVRDLFIQDDFTFVNLEGALTDYNVPVEKEYRFRGPPAYGQILLKGGIDAVTLANNHSGDYGKTGLADTRQVLSDLGIAAGGDKETFLCTTDRGLTIGVYTAYHIGKAEVRQAVEDLRAQGPRSSSPPSTWAQRAPTPPPPGRRRSAATPPSAAPTSSTTAIPTCSSPWSGGARVSSCTAWGTSASAATATPPTRTLP